MHKAGRFTDMFSQAGKERDHVMSGLAFELVDPVDLKLALLPDRCSSFFGYLLS